MSTQVAIVNGDSRTSEALEVLLRTTPGLLLGPTCRTGQSALRELPPFLPQVVLVEPNLIDSPPFWVVLRLRAALPRLRVIVLSRDMNLRTVQMAVAAGAHGLLPLQAPPIQIVNAVFQVASGGACLDPQALLLLVERLQLEPGEMGAVMDLTRREEEVLDGHARGFRAKEVADWLHISTYTVQTHIRNIYSKLGARSVAHAIARYHPLGRFSFRPSQRSGAEGEN